jgi:hypothetical protein
MATKEYKPMEPKARKAIKFTDSLVEVVYCPVLSAGKS